MSEGNCNTYEEAKYFKCDYWSGAQLKTWPFRATKYVPL